MRSVFYCAIVGITMLACAGSAQAASIIINGSFETPVVPAASRTLFSTGSSFTGWSVIGATGDVGVFSGTYSSPNFPAEDGLQWLDLTGSTRTATGVQQVVSTTSGALYDLSFWVGNNTLLGSTSTVNFLLNGVQTLAATNSTATTVQNWKLFTFQFTASSASTTLAFMNGDPSNDDLNGLDNVQLSAHDSGVVPEPSSLAICCGGLAALVLLSRRKRLS